MSINIKFVVLLSMQCWGVILSNEVQIKEEAILLGISSQNHTDQLVLTCTAYGEPIASVEWAMDIVTENWITSNTTLIEELPVTISILEICDANIPKYFQVSCSAVNNVVATSASVVVGYQHVLFNITDGVVHAIIGQKVEMGRVSTSTNMFSTSTNMFSTSMNTSPPNRRNSEIVIAVATTVGVIILVAIIAAALLVAYAIYAKTSSVTVIDLQPHSYNHLQHRSATATTTQPEYLVPGIVSQQTGNVYATKALGYSNLNAARSHHCNEGTDHRYTDLIHRQHNIATDDDDDGMIYCGAYEDGNTMKDGKTMEDGKTMNHEYQNIPQDKRTHQYTVYGDLQSTDLRTVYQNMNKDQNQYVNT